MTEFFNAKNLTYQYFLNDTRMCRFSLFANACVLALDNPDTISISGTATCAEDATSTLTATTYPVSATVTWKSSDETIATVEAGVVTGVSAGKATITAINGNASASVEFTVTAKANGGGGQSGASD
ncbi:MAG: Ig-like domain-containing protein [Bacteroidales bacterium]|nr:Ig-like domain-containing protein [Bacteroidales bacterium]